MTNSNFAQNADIAKALRLIGLARRGGNLGIGTEAIRSLARCKKARLVLLTADCSENTQKRIRDTAEFHKCDLLEIEVTKDELGAVLGKSETAAVAISDKNLAIEIKKLFSRAAEVSTLTTTEISGE